MGSVKRTHPEAVMWQKLFKQAHREDQRCPLPDHIIQDWVDRMLARYSDDDDFTEHLRKLEGEG